MDELLSEFLSETRESLDKLDNDIVALESDPSSTELINDTFRTFHTIKGTSGFLDLTRLGKVAHAAESLMSKFRDKEIEINSDRISVILDAIDRIKMLIDTVASTSHEPDGSDEDIIAKLKTAQGAAPPPAPTEPATAKEPAKDSEPETGSEPEKDSEPETEEAKDSEKETEEAKDSGKEKEPAPTASTEKEADANAAAAAEADADPSSVLKGDALKEYIDNLFGDNDDQPSEPSKQSEKSEQKESAPAESNKEAIKDEKSSNEKPSADSKSTEVAKTPQAPKAKQENVEVKEVQSVHVKVPLLEGLMNIVSELVLTRNQLLQLMRRQPENTFSESLQRLNLITSELQEGVMKTRMQPVSSKWNKFPRQVRDLSRKLNKPLQLRMLGQDTELDRQVLELINDPLLHLIRNAADHGIESPQERRAANKPETGTITLNAYHEGGHILIEVSDDGQGLNLDVIRQKLIDSGQSSAAEVKEMNSSQLFKNLFLPGFSTAKVTTEVSGRGVGLDVVKSNLDKISGIVEVQTWAGAGSNFSIKIPLTLAIVGALIISCSKYNFALPQISVIEVVRIASRNDQRIEKVQNLQMMRLRNKLLPLIYLDEVLGIAEPQLADIADDLIKNNNYVVVLQAGNFRYGLVIDEILDSEEIVVKPLSAALRQIPYYSGNTILGDGRVIMILDPIGIAANLGQISEAQLSDSQSKHDSELMRISSQEFNYLLFYTSEQHSLKAISLLSVFRIEEIDLEELEYPAGRPSLQYNNQMMPVIKFEETPLLRSGKMTSLIFERNGKYLAVGIGEVRDVIDGQFKIDLNNDSENKKIAGSAIIEGKAIDIIDSEYFLNKYHIQKHTLMLEHGLSNKGKSLHILAIDPDPISNAMLKESLENNGIKVAVVGRGRSGLLLCQQSRQFDAIIISELLPDMKISDFISELRQRNLWVHTPVYLLLQELESERARKAKDIGYSDVLLHRNYDQILNKLIQQFEIQTEAN